MKQKLTLFILALFTAMGAWAATEYTITYDTSTGTFYRGGAASTDWSSKWVSNEAGKPVVTISTSVNNMNGANGRMAPQTYNISVEDGCVVKGFSLNCPTFGGDITFTPSGESPVEVATGGTLVVNSSASSFVFSGANGCRIQAAASDGGSFTITVEKASDEQIAAYNTVQNWITTIQSTKGLVSNAANYTSNAKSSAEGSYEALLDGVYTTYFHGAYGSEGPDEDQYLQAILSKPANAIYFYYKKRSQNNNNRPTSITISGSNDGSNFTDVTTINSGLPTDAAVIDYASNKINLGASYQYLRFTVTETNNNAKNTAGHVFFTFSEFYVLPSETTVDDVMNLYATLAGTPALDYTAQNIEDVTAANTALLSTVINVTYNLYESDGTTLVDTKTVEQEKNSAVSIPSSLSGPTYYDYATEGTIGDSDCTIKVIRTLKAGYVISLDGFSNNKCYNIRNNRGTWAVGSGATDVNSTVELSLAFLSTDTKQQFAFITYEGNVYLYSVGESKFAYVDGTKLSLTSDVTSAVAASPVTFQASTNTTYQNSEPIIVTVGGNMFGVSTGKSPDVFKYNVQSDGGNCAYIIEAGSFDATAPLAALAEYFHPSYTVTYIVKDGSDNVLFTSDPVGTTNGATITTLPAEYQRAGFYTYNTVNVTISASGNTNVEFTATPKAEPIVQYTADTTSPYYYNLNIRSKYLVYDDQATGEVTLQNESEPFNENAAWAFIGEPYAGFKVINQAKGENYDLTYTSVVTGNNSGADGSNNNVQFVADDEFNNRYWIIESNTGGFCMRMKENTNIYFHHQSIANTNGYLRTCSVSEWSAVHNDAGSTIVASTDEDVLIALYNTLAANSYGTAIGQYNSTDANLTIDDITSTLSDVDAVIQAGTTSLYGDAYDALVELSGKIAIVTPADGYYRLKNASTGKYLRVISDAQGGIVADVEPANAASTPGTIVKIETSDGHQFYNCQSREFRQCYNDKPITAPYGTHDKYALYSTQNIAGQLAIAFAYGNGTGANAAYVEGAYYAPNGENDIVGTTSNAAAAQWIFEEVSSVTVGMHGDGNGDYYATFCAPFGYTVDGATAYTLTKSGEWLVPEEVVGEVPAGTPVLLNGTSATAALTIGTGYAGTPIVGDLTGTYFAITIDGANDYVLGIKEGVVGFYHWASNSLGANRAYVTAGGGSVKGYVVMFDDDATSIDEELRVKNEESSDCIFNLAGQRLNKIQKGINIVNGKKILF